MCRRRAAPVRLQDPIIAHTSLLLNVEYNDASDDSPPPLGFFGAADKFLKACDTSLLGTDNVDLGSGKAYPCIKKSPRNGTGSRTLFPLHHDHGHKE